MHGHQGETSVLLLTVLTWIIDTNRTSLRDPDILVPTIIQGLIIYFDKSLGATLLYRFERPQYAEMRKRFVTGQKVVIGEEREPSAIYGAEHLLRMLGKIFYRHICAVTNDRWVRFSEPPTDGGQFYNGRRVCDSSEGLCEWTIIVS